MGLLDTLVSTAASSLFKDTNGDGQIQAMEIVQQLVQQNGGNVGNLLNMLQQNGLNDIVASWIGNGSNAQVGANDLQNALGNQLTEAAAKVGLDSSQASSLLAQYLPQIINTLTPNGNASDANGFGLDDIARIAMQQLFK